MFPFASRDYDRRETKAFNLGAIMIIIIIIIISISDDDDYEQDHDRCWKATRQASKCYSYRWIHKADVGSKTIIFFWPLN